MRILVTFAVDAEFAPWRKRHRFEERELRIQGFRKHEQNAYSSRIGNSLVDVFLTGIGWDHYGNNAARHGIRALLHDHPNFCISSGLAGGLKRDYQVGDIVVAENVSSYKRGLKIRGHERLFTIAEDCGAKPAEQLVSWNHIVAESKAKRALGVFADIVDMESFFVMTAVSGSKVPSVAVRAISDSWEEDLPIDFSRVLDRKGNLKRQRLLVELSRHPERIPAIIGFGKRSRRATESLANFLDTFVPAIEEQFEQSQLQAHREAAAR